MKNNSIICIFFTCCCLVACKTTPFVELPSNTVDEKPIFNVSADIEGRTMPFRFVSGEGKNLMDLLFTEGGPTVIDGLELATKLGALRFTYPFSKESTITGNKNISFFEDSDEVIDYSISGSGEISFHDINDISISIDDSLMTLMNFNVDGFWGFVPRTPKKIDLRSKLNPQIYQTYFNPLENPFFSSMSLTPEGGLFVSSPGMHLFNWNTGSNKFTSVIDSSLKSNYYCVTTTANAHQPDNRIEACGLVTKNNFNTFSLEASNWIITLKPIISFNANSQYWFRLSFTDQDGTVYNSELGRQPSSSFFMIESATPYKALDFKPSQFFTNNNPDGNTSLLKLDIRFDCVLFTPYGKKLHLQNGKGTILVTTFE
jgi:hypothetical protein